MPCYRLHMLSFAGSVLFKSYTDERHLRLHGVVLQHWSCEPRRTWKEMENQQSSALITPLKYKRMMASPPTHSVTLLQGHKDVHSEHTHTHTQFHLPFLWPQVCLSLIPRCVGVMGTLWQLSFCHDLNGLQISSGTMIVRIRCVRTSICVKVCALMRVCVREKRKEGEDREEVAFDVKIVVKY